ncbi:MAG: UDP-N-acetylmuramate--L-alanine ligase [Actinobacteria bacterium]|uniref:UDP-N-acetylmuramate--L-alanine ligase n=1 Tax=freshwater metagenome TaxID=449393 RepID=A0A6J6G2G6_9ZZZZ|nr:UDP-N-acetylmuramate--L-alanine ligase [Actinomycetota bacterium]
MIAPDLAQQLPESLGVVHFIGIGGSGMSGIARMCVERGLTVTGSDRSDSSTVEALRAIGVSIQIGHEPEAVTRADTVVVTGALWTDNPEYQWALQHELLVIHRSLALHWLSRNSRVISIAGAHGKTTTTSMVVIGLRELGFDPSFVNGGVVTQLGVSAATGTDDLFVLEADESDGSFLAYNTAIGLITNIDTDHLDAYGSAEAFDDAFVSFANACSESVVVSSDDEHLGRLRSRIVTPVITFGESTTADVRVSNIVSSASGVSAHVSHHGAVAILTMSVPGAHNAINAVGAATVLMQLGHSLDAAVAAVSTFGGTGRRFELHGVRRGVAVYDDYAHHPSEVRATLAMARSVVGEGRIIAIHQPHLFSRTRDMAEEFANEYETGADLTIVLDVYGAREDPIDGVTGQLVVDRFADDTKVLYRPDWAQAAEAAANHAREGDIIITLSCGDVYRIIPSVLGELGVE